MLHAATLAAFVATLIVLRAYLASVSIARAKIVSFTRFQMLENLDVRVVRLQRRFDSRPLAGVGVWSCVAAYGGHVAAGAAANAGVT